MSVASKILIVLLLASAIAGVAVYKSQQRPPVVALQEAAVAQPDAEPEDAPQEASMAEVESAPAKVEAPPAEPARPKLLPKMLDLGADKCIPCKAMAPILEALKKEYAGRVEVQFIDVWKKPQAGQDYGVRMIPTQIFFDATGKERFRHTGFMSREDILGKWKELGML
jgi:thioredoxin 1